MDITSLDNFELCLYKKSPEQFIFRTHTQTRVWFFRDRAPLREYQIGQFSPKLRVLMVELNVLYKDLICNYIFYILK